MTGNIYPTMKRLIALAVVALASQAIATFAGEPVTTSKEVVAPPPPPPVSYFRANEWSLGLFGTYGWTYDGNRRGIQDHYWGGGVDGQYFPLQHWWPIQFWYRLHGRLQQFDSLPTSFLRLVYG